MSSFAPLVILRGKEQYLLDKRLQDIVNEMAAVDGEQPYTITLDTYELTPQELARELEESSLFAYRKVIIMRNPHFVVEGGRTGPGKKEMKKVVESFLARETASTHVHVIITLSDQVSAKDEWVSLAEKFGSLENIPPYSKARLKEWLKEEIKKRNLMVDDDAIQVMLKSGRDMYYLLEEVNRLSLCLAGKRIKASDLTVDMDYQDTSIFRLTDALLAKDPAKTWEALNFLYLKGEPVARIIYMITKELILLSKVRFLLASGKSPQNIAQKLGQKEFRIEKMASFSASFEEDELKEVFRLLADADRLSKSGREDKVVLETIVLEICNR